MNFIMVKFLTIVILKLIIFLFQLGLHLQKNVSDILSYLRSFIA